MSQQNNFLGGFLLGTLIGGIVGGVAGVLVSSRLPDDDTETAPETGDRSRDNNRLPTDHNMEVSRRSLEDKIAQLHDAIDDVRHQLSTVNEHPPSSANGEQILQEY